MTTPHLSERQRDLLRSLGLTVEVGDLSIILVHPDATITRLDPAQVDAWLDGFMKGAGK